MRAPQERDVLILKEILVSIVLYVIVIKINTEVFKSRF